MEDIKNARDQAQIGTQTNNSSRRPSQGGSIQLTTQIAPPKPKPPEPEPESDESILSQVELPPSEIDVNDLPWYVDEELEAQHLAELDRIFQQKRREHYEKTHLKRDWYMHFDDPVPPQPIPEDLDESERERFMKEQIKQKKKRAKKHIHIPESDYSFLDDDEIEPLFTTMEEAVAEVNRIHEKYKDQVEEARARGEILRRPTVPFEIREKAYNDFRKVMSPDGGIFSGLYGNMFDGIRKSDLERLVAGKMKECDRLRERLEKLNVPNEYLEIFMC